MNENIFNWSSRVICIYVRYYMRNGFPESLKYVKFKWLYSLAYLNFYQNTSKNYFLEKETILDCHLSANILANIFSYPSKTNLLSLKKDSCKSYLIISFFFFFYEFKNIDKFNVYSIQNVQHIYTDTYTYLHDIYINI